jgi:hypothetical protein
VEGFDPPVRGKEVSQSATGFLFPDFGRIPPSLREALMKIVLVLEQKPMTTTNHFHRLWRRKAAWGTPMKIDPCSADLPFFGRSAVFGPIRRQKSRRPEKARSALQDSIFIGASGSSGFTL